MDAGGGPEGTPAPERMDSLAFGGRGSEGTTSSGSESETSSTCAFRDMVGVVRGEVCSVVSVCSSDCRTVRRTGGRRVSKLAWSGRLGVGVF